MVPFKRSYNHGSWRSERPPLKMALLPPENVLQGRHPSRTGSQWQVRSCSASQPKTGTVQLLGIPWGRNNKARALALWILLSSHNKIIKKGGHVGGSQLTSFNWLHSPSGNPPGLANKNMHIGNFPLSQSRACYRAWRLMLPDIRWLKPVKEFQMRLPPGS